MTMKVHRNENGLVLKWDNTEAEVKYSMGAALEAEREFGNISEAYEAIFTINGCLKLLEILVNESIKRYNKEYNQSEKPVDIEYITEELGLEDNIGNLTDMMIRVRSILLREQGESKKN